MPLPTAQTPSGKIALMRKNQTLFMCIFHTERKDANLFIVIITSVLSIVLLLSRSKETVNWEQILCVSFYIQLFSSFVPYFTWFFVFACYYFVSFTRSFSITELRWISFIGNGGSYNNPSMMPPPHLASKQLQQQPYPNYPQQQSGSCG